jgi:hypothetical protein
MLANPPSKSRFIKIRRLHKPLIAVSTLLNAFGVSHVPSFRGPQREIVCGLSCFYTYEPGNLVHYVVYLDEFGHIGPYVSRDHKNYNDSPVFGLAGVMLPAQEVREFAIFFYKLKCRLLAWDLQNKNPGKLPAYQWEKRVRRSTPRQTSKSIKSFDRQPSGC